MQLFFLRFCQKFRLMSKGGIFLNLLFNILQCKFHRMSNMDVDKNKNASFFFPAGEVYQNQLRCRRIHRWGQYRNLYPHFQDRQKKISLHFDCMTQKNIQTVFVYLLYFIFKRENFFEWCVTSHSNSFGQSLTFC